MKRYALLLLLLSGIVFQTACGEKEASLSKPPARLAVRAAAIQYESVPAVVEAPGTVQPRHRVALSSQINGFVRDIRVRAGDRVEKDQLLATLDARDAESQTAAARAALDEAQAALSEAQKSHQAAVQMRAAASASSELAEQTLARYQKLFDARSASPQEIDEVRSRRNASAAELASREAMVAAAADRVRQVEARISQAKAQASRADVWMSWTQIKAPASGRIVERPVDPGTAIFPGTPLLVLESIAQPQVLADIPTEQAASLRVGMSVAVHGAGIPGPLEGRISEIVPLSNPATHSVQFKVDLPANAAFSSGQFVTVDIPVGRRNALLAPSSAIRRTGQLTGLFVVDEVSKACFRLIKLAPYDAARSEILSGVEPGETNIEKPSDSIVDGTSVEIRP